MIDIKLIRTNPELVKENIKKKFQDEKLVLVDEVAQFDEEYRAAKTKADELRNKRKVMSKQIGGLMAKGQKDEAEKVKAEVSAIGAELDAMAEKEKELEGKIRERMLVIPNIIDPSVPIGKDDSENVEIEKFGEPVVPDYEIPSYGRHCKTSFCNSFICQRFHDRQRFHIFHSSLHDTFRRCYRRYELF